MAKQLNYSSPAAEADRRPRKKLTPRERAMMQGRLNASGGIVRDTDRKTAKSSGDAEFKDYLWPLILIVVSFAAFIIAGLVLEGVEGAAAVGIASVVIGVVQTVLLVAAAFAAAFLFGIGFGEFKLAVVQLAAAGLFSWAVSLIPFPFIGTVAFFATVMILMDLDFSEALALAVMHFVVQLLVGLVIVGMIMSA